MIQFWAEKIAVVNFWIQNQAVTDFLPKKNSVKQDNFLQNCCFGQIKFGTCDYVKEGEFLYQTAVLGVRRRWTWAQFFQSEKTVVMNLINYM